MKKWCYRTLSVALSVAMLGSIGMSLSSKADSTISGLTTRMEEVVALTGIFGSSGIYVLNYDREVSRAEFAQILVNLTGKEKEAYMYAGASLYQDVLSNNEQIGFIKLAVSNGWMSAYMNGTFKPEQSITLREAAKAAMTALGYSDSDFSGNITTAQILKFNALGLNENINRTATEALTVKDCMHLVYNLLSVKNKEGKYYAETLGYAVDDEGDVQVLSMIKEDLKGPYLISPGTTDWKNLLPFSTDGNTAYYMNEYKSSAGSMLNAAVIYYSSELNVVFGYSDFTIGTVSSIEPSPLEITGIVFEDKTYSVSDSVKEQLSGWTKDSLDESYIVYFGMDDKVVKIQPVSDYYLNTFRGVVLWTGHADGEYTVTIARTNGNVSTVAYDPNEISLYPKDIVDVTKIGTEYYFAKQSTTKLNAELYNHTVEVNEDDEDEYLAGDYWILGSSDVLAVYYDAEEDSYDIEELSGYQLEGITFNASNLLYATANSSKEIKQLILYNPEVITE